MSDNYDEWDRPALMNEAREKFDVKFDPKMTKAQMVNKLRELHDSEQYLMNEAAGEVQEPEPEEPPAGGRKVRIKIHKSDGPDGANDVKVGLNGRAYAIKRDVEVDIPETVYKACILGAVQTMYEPVNNPVTGQIDITERDVDRFAHTMYGYSDTLGPIVEPKGSESSLMKHNLR